ncbi:hypothetical protein GQ600_26632 [Phytophthora cactorum]|nr:hypothetical protein GQ600_26632 [Phytophthora cactorum]
MQTKKNYYTALLTCFKPHRSGELICGAFDLEREYCNFLQSNSGSAQIDMIAFEQKWMDYYRSEDKTEEVEKSQEEILLRTRATSSAPWEPYASDNDGTDFSAEEDSDNSIDDDVDPDIQQIITESLYPSPIDAVQNCVALL